MSVQMQGGVMEKKPLKIVVDHQILTWVNLWLRKGGRIQHLCFSDGSGTSLHLSVHAYIVLTNF